MRSIFLRFIAGVIAGALIWMFFEPSAFSHQMWETQFILSLGGAIGLALGLVAGGRSGSLKQMALTGGLGLLLGAVGASVGYQVGGLLLKVIYGPGILLDPNPNPLRIMARTTAIAPIAAFIGLGVGVASRKLKTALVGGVGGAIGGILAGALFDPIAILLGGMLQASSGNTEVGQVSRAMTAVLIGGLVGLFIGLVERVATSAWVRLILGKNEGKDYLIDSPNTLIGRGEMCEVPLFGDPQIMPQHAVIQKQGSQYWISAIDPVTAVVLNGNPVKQAPLASGDYLQVGRFTLQFMIKGYAAKRDPQFEAYRGAVQMPVGAPQPGPFVAHAGPQATMAMPQPGAIPISMPTQVMQAAQPMPVQGVLTLVATAGPLTGQRFPLAGPLELGRESGPIPMGFDAMASRRHASLMPMPGGVQVTDLGSTNGTMVNGMRIQTGLLNIGDSLTIGATTFRLEQ